MSKAVRVLTINPHEPEHDLIKQAAEIAGNSAPLVFPTDTVYGIGVAVKDAEALNALYQIKERDPDKAIPWLVLSVKDLGVYGAEVPDYAYRLAEKHWPGALTLIVKASAAVPEEFRAYDGSIALRAPDCPIALELIRELGVPLAASSANKQGHEPPIFLEDVDADLIEAVELAIDGGVCEKKYASTIVSCLEEKPQIIRQGAITREELCCQFCHPEGHVCHPEGHSPKDHAAKRHPDKSK